MASAPVAGFLSHCPAASPFFVFLTPSTLLAQIYRPGAISAQTVIGMSESDNMLLEVRSGEVTPPRSHGGEAKASFQFLP